jgi:hypothetical protein
MPCVLTELFFPLAQGLQNVAPGCLVPRPGWHKVQDNDEVLSSRYFPTAHFVHSRPDMLLYFPGPHFMHLALPFVFEEWPALQSEQLVWAEELLTLPTMHLGQSFAKPVTFPNSPGRQGKHVAFPVSFW